MNSIGGHNDDDDDDEASRDDAAAGAAAASVEDGAVFKATDGKWAARVSADADLVRFVVGNGGEAMQRLEQETGAKIVLPKERGAAAGGRGDADGLEPRSGEILVRALTTAAAASAKTRMDALLDEVLASRSLPYTHFLNIPLNLGREWGPATRHDRRRCTSLVFFFFLNSRQSTGRSHLIQKLLGCRSE